MPRQRPIDDRIAEMQARVELLKQRKRVEAEMLKLKTLTKATRGRRRRPSKT